MEEIMKNIEKLYDLFKEFDSVYGKESTLNVIESLRKEYEEDITVSNVVEILEEEKFCW